MKRAGFTITFDDGTTVDANHLSVTRHNVPEDHDGKGQPAGSISMLTFISSGEASIVPAAWVKSITFSPTGLGHCSECDGPLYPIVGAGIHANPPGPAPGPRLDVYGRTRGA